MQLSAKQFEENMRRFSAHQEPQEPRPLFTSLSAFVTSFVVTLAVILYVGAWIKVGGIL